MIREPLKVYKNLPEGVKASLWFTVCTLMQKGVLIITTPIFTRILSPEEYGQFSVFTSWQGIISVFITLNLFAGVYMQGMVKFEEDNKRFTASVQSLYTALTLLWSLIYFLNINFWNNLLGFTTTQMLAMILIIWSAGIFSFWMSEQRVNYKYKFLVIITFLTTITSPLLGVLMVINSQDKVTARILSIAIINVVFYSVFYLIKIIKSKTFFIKKYWKYAILFNIPLLPHYLSMTILNSADRIMIDSITGSDNAGIYSLAYSLALLMTVFTGAILQSIEPFIYKKIKEQSYNAISDIIYPLLILVALINILLIAFAPEIIKIFAPSEYYDAIWVIPPVSMGVYFSFMYTFFATFEFYYEKRIFITISTMSGAIANIILNLIFINLFGYIAAGYTTLVCYIIYAGAHYLFMKKVCKENIGDVKIYDHKKIIIISSGFLLIGFILLVSYLNILIRMLIILLIVVATVLNKKTIINYINNIIKIREER